MSGLSCTKLTLFTVAGVAIQLVGLSLFVFGFFPVKPTLPGHSGAESFRAPTCNSIRNESLNDLPPHHLTSLYKDLSGIPPAFDRLILMVIDGLPAEFVLGKDGEPPRKDLMEAMPYTQSLLGNGMAIGYHAKAAPPTVTMPRLKAMVSGAIGGFLDVALNFNTQAMVDDNLLGQFFKIGWKMVMLGDETWLKLFPGLFMRHDGVSSFFVKDTVQVDQNVSRHLGHELSRDDWNFLILHYLGLDHVGHTGGRNSALMAPKLTEMDEVVKMIHMTNILNQKNDQGQTLLVVVSDHGMTESGNHGGSSYEETDSLALFIGLKNDVSDYLSSTHNNVDQVDIAPTLALLLGVPIPKNNVGVLIPEIFGYLSEDKQLKALELNSWQLVRLLQAQIPGLSCRNHPCDGSGGDQESRVTKCYGSIERMCCCLYTNAALLKKSWMSKEVSRSNSRKDYTSTVAAYYEFLRTASEWLSRRATDKPVSLLTLGIAAMFLSCLILLSLLFHIYKEVYTREMQCPFDLKSIMQTWCLEETFILGVTLILIISMTSSSLVEEEQYIWHFMASTLHLLLLRKAIQSCVHSFSRGQNKTSGLQMSSICVLLISGRILRGWHQGGVNWTNLPDISKWLEKAGNDNVKSVQLVACLLVIALSLYALVLFGSNRNIVLVIGFSFLVSGLLVVQNILKHQDGMFASSSYSANTLVQITYAILGVSTSGTVIALPWLVPFSISETGLSHDVYMSSASSEVQNKSLLMKLRESLFLIGWAYISCWCLLQLLLQQTINSMPILLLHVQTLASMLYFSYSGLHHNQWVEVSAFYFLGMAGHFALGNSNSLATIDVAGAFIGISSHSTVLSGILMFIITYASPMLFILSMVMYISLKDTSYFVSPSDADLRQLLKMMIGFPCLLPLGLNSILLTAYTIVLVFMSNHLFVWSVFSPKYIYVCTTTICVYVGVSVIAATVTYAYLVLGLRRKKQYKLRHQQ
ncbi:putative Type I phosphodiesterase/nucleotide pyrophosphatase/phosphate transferase [Rosa chinensis]|uniref:Putative Type I phosphodiesterase/nucleotide pyrophosphatase/phosphate transferase n=2 Tax=Rosa chinensis TaxID=74649 RepID=A0A2P6RQ25_ROSCH|nr:GPI ethanolamine phosphate transferase 2 isoform X1 [Rosa chinensis]XP_024185503.1 GPI ethanolamine phosphate transferase 2 isoform X1 [Rosa chinensis]PRQ48491.1 putative Type I phosphodiesterase/nucleotide pyrophosphatase/phosphate transferase [Rosa chinensis]